MKLISIIKRSIPDSVKIDILRKKDSLDRLIHRRKKIQTDFQYYKIGNSRHHTFFGYYDISPFNSRNEILYLQLNSVSSAADIVVDDYKGGRKKIVAKTDAWNWQQGCRLRWFPGTDDTIIFNDFKEGRHISRIVNLATKEESSLPMPLYDISSNGKLGLSLDFTRLGYMRPGYGYTNLPFQERGEDMLYEGIDIIDVSQGKVLKTISYSDIAKAMNIKEENVGNWYLNHLSFSPDGNKFLFFFLKKVSDTFFTAQMLVYDLNSEEIKLLEPELKNSHYTWLNNDLILCTAYSLNNNKVCCGYYRYDTKTTARTQVCQNSLNRDGHPTYFDRGKTLLTDTYPDNISFQYIYKVNVENDEKSTIISVYNRLASTPEKRTDLHPRFNNDKTLICFDANIRSYRNVFILKLS